MVCSPFKGKIQERCVSVQLRRDVFIRWLLEEENILSKFETVVESDSALSDPRSIATESILRCI